MAAEALVGLCIAITGGVSALTSRLHNRITELDRRIDGVELRVAEQYVSKSELSEIMQRMEAHMVRIEDKLDRIVEAR